MKVTDSYKYAIVVLCLLLSTNSVAQEEPNNEKKTPLYKYDLSIDLYQLFSNGEATVMLRYGSWEKGALRAQLGTSYFSNRENNSSQFDTIPQPPSSKFKFKTGNLNLRIGYEFHKSYDKHQIFYGSDIGYGHYFADNSYINVGVAKNNKISLTPFFGVKYKIIPRLSVSMEMALSMEYFVQSQFNHLNIKQGEDKQLSISFYPLRFLNVSYHF
ncbi:hypothetical protein LZD49_32350 [Dyadobacter sp. CY261]|uniref:hypothetical protein n=1 Tax=Dyadobacter sp. CY261 TaxID=2907203 RepID=UPI001F18977B|nr:hypothetical protein [Dyadobacter sp. CY261]MCF0075219.1 hypothetical protein [Dyadobacter sp. CY261]